MKRGRRTGEAVKDYLKGSTINRKSMVKIMTNPFETCFYSLDRSKGRMELYQRAGERVKKKKRVTRVTNIVTSLGTTSSIDSEMPLALIIEEKDMERYIGHQWL
jgi:hypothetical protein